MYGKRLGICLKAIRWGPATLAESLNVEPELVNKWLSDQSDIPTTVSAWIEALTFTHEASDLMRPNISNSDRQGIRADRQRLEHIPVYSYGLLRDLNQGAVPIVSLYGTDNEAAVAFLISRGLAARADDKLVITTAGRSLGEIAAS